MGVMIKNTYAHTIQNNTPVKILPCYSNQLGIDVNAHYPSRGKVPGNPYCYLYVIIMIVI